MLALGDSKTAGDEWVQLLCDALTVVDGPGHWSEQPTRYGISGATAASLSAYVDTNLPNESLSPRVALLNIGANDVAEGTAEATAKAALLNIGDKINAKWPSCLVYVAKPWRRNYTAQCNTFAGWIDDVVALRAFFRTGHDERAWLEGGDDGATYTTDGIHYSAAGETECANQWATALGY